MDKSKALQRRMKDILQQLNTVDKTSSGPLATRGCLNSNWYDEGDTKRPNRGNAPTSPITRICKVLIAGKGAEILKFSSTFHVPIAKEQFTSGAIKIKTECIRIFPYKNVLCEEPLGVRATVLFLLQYEFIGRRSQIYRGATSFQILPGTRRWISLPKVRN